MRTALAGAVADALGPRIVSVEQIEDFAEARLGEAGLDDVVPAHVIYRQATSSPRQKLWSGGVAHASPVSSDAASARAGAVTFGPGRNQFRDVAR
jgi:hypothetical protein